jgi:hypothetical protein
MNIPQRRNDAAMMTKAMPATIVSRRLHSRFSRLLRDIIGVSDAKYKGTGRLRPGKRRFFAFATGFGGNKAYI